MKVLGLLTLLHLLVDGVCGGVLAVYALQEPRLEPIVFYFSLYTVFAFGLQGPVGWILDRTTVYLKHWLGASILLLALGAIPQLCIAGQAVLLGLGNCVFHVVGGSYVLRQYTTYSQLGIFVCSGAVGLGLGLYSLANVLTLLILACCLTAMTIKELEYPSNINEALAYKEKFLNEKTPLELWGIALLLFCCIIFRGFGSGGLNSSYVMLLPCTFALGKFLGGIICDKIGYKRTVLLILISGFIGLQCQGIYANLLFILACNMTMPLTLRLAHWCCIDSPGLMFGLAASCLVPGTLFKDVLSFPPQLILTLQFLALFVAGYTLLKKEYENVQP